MQKRTVTIDGVEKTFHEAHQDLWNELSQNPGMTKNDYFNKHIILVSVRNHCFACKSCDTECKRCPIVLWRNDAKNFDMFAPCNFWKQGGDPKDGLFSEWTVLRGTGKYGEACKVAKKIADLEWEEVEE